MEQINKNSTQRDCTKGEPDTIQTKNDDTKETLIQFKKGTMIQRKLKLTTQLRITLRKQKKQILK